MTGADHDDVLENRAASLEQSMISLTAEFQRLTKRTRLQGWVIVVGVVLLLAVGSLAAVALDASARATDAASLAHHNRQAQIETCRATNEARAVQIRLWSTVLELSQKLNVQTPERIAAADRFRALVANTFAPRDCNALTPDK